MILIFAIPLVSFLFLGAFVLDEWETKRQKRKKEEAERKRLEQEELERKQREEAESLE